VTYRFTVGRNKCVYVYGGIDVYKDTDAMIEWCRENFKGFVWEMPIVHGKAYKCRIKFANESDIMVFLLKWAGHETRI
jgi:hypothetical protein